MRGRPSETLPSSWRVCGQHHLAKRCNEWTLGGLVLVREIRMLVLAQRASHRRKERGLFDFDRNQPYRARGASDGRDFSLEGVPGWLKMPAWAKNVIQAIPEWLQAQVQTVVGTQIRVRQIRWSVQTITVANPIPIDTVAPMRGVNFDPAVVVGPIVLAGWEAPEHFTPGWWMRYDLRRLSRSSL